MSKTIRELATEAYTYFTRKSRTSGSDYWCLKDDAPEWVSDLCYAAHSYGRMGPDDYRYEFIWDAVCAIKDETEDDLEADIYNGQLTGWLHSRADRYAYVDEAIEECGCEFSSIMDAISLGQLREKQEVLQQVQDYLEKRVEELEEEEFEDSLIEEVE